MAPRRDGHESPLARTATAWPPARGCNFGLLRPAAVHMCQQPYIYVRFERVQGTSSYGKFMVLVYNILPYMGQARAHVSADVTRRSSRLYMSSFEIVHEPAHIIYEPAQ